MRRRVSMALPLAAVSNDMKSHLETAFVFVHGLACSASDWDTLKASVLRPTEQITVSLPGHDARPFREEDFTIESLANVVNSARENLASPYHILVGHSMGARIVLEAAVQNPRRVAGVVLIDSSLQATGDADATIFQRRALSDIERAARTHALFAGMFCGAPMPAFAEALMSRIASIDPTLIYKFGEGIVRWDARFARDRISRVTAPLLVIQTTTAEQGSIRRSIRSDENTRWTDLLREQAGERAMIVNMVGMGHFPHVESPDRIAHALKVFIHTINSSSHTTRFQDVQIARPS